ncbi:MAG: hypothetical protein CMJ83_03605 [Planctomycetes bacterium]|nr:hypothetical protein [Planctomycetota bacterium]
MTENILIPEPLEKLIARYGPRTLQILVRILGPDEAGDAYQETWLAVWNARGDFRRTTWRFVRRVAMARAVDRIRTRDRGPRIATGVDPDPAVETTDAPEIDLNRLLPLERAALTLHFWEGMSIREIATELGAPVNTVKTWMHRGRERLRRQILQEEERR